MNPRIVACTGLGCVAALSLALLLGVTACSAWRANTYTLSPAVKESARRYSDVMDDFADQALLANVLRAKDYAPMNFNDLSSVTGALSLSGTLGFTLPFGPFIGYKEPPKGDTSIGAPRNTFSPSFSGSTSPVINIGTLNTQGFMMTMIQPISTTYILSKWDSYSHELLLLLFIKSIRFPGEMDDGTYRRSYRNDPDSESEFRDFQTLIERMMANTSVGVSSGTAQVGNVDMKSLMILDPLGNPVPMGKVLTATTPIPSQTLSVPAPAAPKMEAGSGNPPAGSYFAQVTYVTSLGETLPSPETSYQTNTSGLQGVKIYLTQATPPQAGPNATGYNVYVGTSSGSETRQNPRPLALGSPWIVPNGGLTAGGTPPGQENGHYATSLPVAPGTQYAVQGDYNIFQTISGLADGQLHVGNSGCPTYLSTAPRLDPTDLCPAGSPAPFAQFYKEYPAQTVLCLDVPDDGLFFGHHIYASSEQTQQQVQYASTQLPGAKQRLILARQNLSAVTGEVFTLDRFSPGEARKAKAQHEAKQEAATSEVKSAEKHLNDLNAIIQWPQEKAARSEFRVSSMAVKGPASTGAPAAAPAGGSGGGNPGGGGGNNGAGGGTPGAMGQVTLALQPNRISAIVPSTMCKGDQFVLHQESEEDFDQESQKFTHIEWRSIAEVIQYLGAVARYQDRHHGANPQFIQWVDSAGINRVFTYAPGTDGRIAVDYPGGPYSVPLYYKHLPSGVVDRSLQTLAVLNELISIAKISGGLPVPQPVQVLP